jgi:hypothetical protein
MIYITVNPKLLLLQAPNINRAVAIKKKMYAQNIGGLGEYHINTNAAITLETIPSTSQQNRKGLDL